MKIIQTYYQNNDFDWLNYSSNYISPEFHWISWALSCVTLSKFYKVELYTNKLGKEILANTLKIPYFKVHTDLDSFVPLHSKLWAMPKVYTYSLQTEPFMHVDGDVFIWDEFPEEIVSAKLFSQYKENDFSDYYGTIYREMVGANFTIPAVMRKQYEIEGEFHAYNAGIFGGNDIDFINKYTKRSFEFLEANTYKFEKVNVEMLNVMAEQYMFYAIAEQNSQEVKLLLNLYEEPDEDSQGPNFADFLGVPHITQFIHLLGYKKLDEVCIMMAKRLRMEKPDLYHHILKTCQDANIGLMISTNLDSSESSYFVSYKESRIEKFLISNSIVENTNSLVAVKFSGRNYFIDDYCFSLYTDLLQYTESMSIKNFTKFTARDIELDITHFAKIADFNVEDKLDSYLFCINSSLQLINTLQDWTSRSSVDKPVEKNANSTSTQIALWPECFTNRVMELNCDSIVKKLINAVEKPVSFQQILEQVKEAFVKKNNIEIDSPEDISEFKQFILEQLRHSVFTGIIQFYE